MKARSERVQKITVTRKADKVYNFSVPATQINKDVEIWVAVYQKPKSLKMRGKSVTYTNVLKNYLSLGLWRGEQLTKAISPVVDSKSTGFTVVAQEVKSGKIIAAGDYTL